MPEPNRIKPTKELKNPKESKLVLWSSLLLQDETDEQKSLNPDTMQFEMGPG